MNGGAREIGVAIATFNRCDELRLLLQSLTELDPKSTPQFAVAVVDNDPTGGAEKAVEDFVDALELRYVVEPRPGISSARNRGVSVLGDCTRIAFVDDDEIVHPSWLGELNAVLNETGATAVHGPVFYRFLEPPRGWIAQGGFFVNPELRELSSMKFAATNNLIVDLNRLPRNVPLTFDDRFGLTGGSDIHLTSRLVAEGGKIVWTNRATVEENVGKNRANPKWALTRAMRTGNTAGRVEIDLAPHPLATRSRVAASGAIRVLAGSARAATGAMFRHPSMAGEGLRTAARGLGYVASATALAYVEYGRAR